MSGGENRNRIPWARLSFGLALSVALSQPALLAQGFFSVYGQPIEVTKNNRSALAGSLIFFVEAGTTGEGKIVVDYGVSIDDSGTVSGDLGASIEETDLASGVLAVQIPQGISADELITLEGVRLDMAGG